MHGVCSGQGPNLDLYRVAQKLIQLNVFSLHYTAWLLAVYYWKLFCLHPIQWLFFTFSSLVKEREENARLWSDKSKPENMHNLFTFMPLCAKGQSIRHRFAERKKAHMKKERVTTGERTVLIF